MLSKRDVTVFTHNCNAEYLLQDLSKWWQCNGTVTLDNMLTVPRKTLHAQAVHDTAIPLLGTYPKEMKT